LTILEYFVVGTVYFSLYFNLSVHRVAPVGRKIPNLTIFSNSTFCGGAIYSGPDTIERGCTTTNLPLSNKTLVSNSVANGDNGLTNFIIQKSSWTKKTFLSPDGMRSPSFIILTTVIVDNGYLVLSLEILGKMHLKHPQLRNPLG